MTVPATARRAGPFNGNGVTTSFPFTFKVFTDEDILVVFADEDGVETDLVLDSTYSVTLNGDQDASPGGSITYPLSGDPLADGETLTVVGNEPYTQELDLPSGGNFSPRAIENALDRTTFQIQQLAEQTGRALKLPVSATADPTLPAPEANKIIGWNDTATGMVNRDVVDLVTAVTYANWSTDVFSGDGTTRTFVLTADPGSVHNCDVAIGGVSQNAISDFTLSGRNLTFVEAPAAGTDNIAVRFGQALPTGVTPTATANWTVDHFTGDGTTTVFTLSRELLGSDYATVVLGGSTLTPGYDFIVAGDVLTFTSAPPAPIGSEPNIAVRHGHEISDDVADAANVSYTAVGGVARTQANKNAEWISVKDRGVVGDGATDDTAAIQAVIDAHPGKTIFFPRSSYRISGTLTVSADNTKLLGLGDATILQYAADTDAVLFAPTTAGASAAFLNGPEISGINVVTMTASTTGAAIRFVQCNGYRLSNLAIYNAAESVTVQGGQYGTLTGWKAFAATGSYLGSRSALVHLRQAPIGGGLYQPCYTVSISDFKCSASKLREACILVSNGDGVAISDSYIANGLNALVMVQAERDNSYVSSLTIDNSYLDCVNTTTGTEWGLYIPADGFAASYVYHVFVGDTCTIGNAKAIGVLCRKPELYDLRIAGQVVNCPNWAIDVEGSTSATNLVVTAKIATAGATGPGGGIRGNSLKSLSVSSVFENITNTCLLTSGTIGHGSISGCVNTSNVADWADSATWTYGVAVAGNASRYAGSQTWKSVQALGGAYDSGHLVLGAYHLWVDSTGDLRIKSSAPSSDTDGTVVGTQS